MIRPGLVRALTLASALICSASCVLPARADTDIVVKSAFAQKRHGGVFDFVYSTDFQGPALNEPGAQYLWESRAGTWQPGDVDDGLRFNPDVNGTPYTLGGHTFKLQAIELLLDTSGSKAFNDEAGTNFDFGATYDLNDFPYGGISLGIALTNLLHQPTSPDKRAFGVLVWQDATGTTNVASKDFLSGQIIAQQAVDSKYTELDVFATRVDPTSSSVRMGARARNDVGDFDIIELRTQIAFSDVVLRPAIFAAAPIPEPRTWVMLLAALVVIAITRSHRRQSAA